MLDGVGILIVKERRLANMPQQAQGRGGGEHEPEQGGGDNKARQGTKKSEKND